MPVQLASPYVLPILMLLGSNIFMTLAWYGHLRFKEVPLAGVIFAAWGIALVEYCLAVPANRWGNEVYSTAQLKTMQEVITLVVFAAAFWRCFSGERSRPPRSDFRTLRSAFASYASKSGRVRRRPSGCLKGEEWYDQDHARDERPAGQGAGGRHAVPDRHGVEGQPSADQPEGRRRDLHHTLCYQRSHRCREAWRKSNVVV